MIINFMYNYYHVNGIDSILSAEAPEFIPRVNGSAQGNPLAAHSYHRNQHSVQMTNHNSYRNQHYAVSQYSVNIVLIVKNEYSKITFLSQHYI